MVVFLILVAVRSAGFFWDLPLLEPQFKWLLLGERLGEGFQMYSETFDYTGPLAAYTYRLLDIIGGRSWFLHQLVATLLVMVQAGILNVILLRNGAYNENNYFPALFYVLAASAIPDAYALSPQLMSLTFILLSINNIFRRIDNVVTDELFLYAGLYLGVAVLFYLPAIVYFLVLISALLLFSSPASRRLLLFFYGMLMPLVVAFCYFIWFDAHWAFIDSYLLRGILDERSYQMGIGYMLVSASLTLALLGLTIMAVLANGKYANFQAKMQQVMILTVGGGLLAMLVDVELGPSQLIFFVPALSFFLAHYILILKRPLFQISLPYLLVIILLLFPWLPFHDNHNLKMERSEVVPERSLLYFGENIAEYQSYRIASPFMDEKLSRFWLEKVDYYQPAARLYDNLSTSDPDVIIDEQGVIGKLFFRYPNLEARYVKKGMRFEKIDLSN